MLKTVRHMEGARGALVAAAAVAATLLASCGGASNANGPDNPDVVTAQSCSPNNPFRGDAESPTTIGSLRSEKLWMRDYIDRQYLWFNEVPNRNPSAANYSDENTPGGVVQSLVNYFFDLLTPLATPSGTPKDQFSGMVATADWNALLNGGQSLSYGIEWHQGSSIRVAYVHANSPAATAGVVRGDTLVRVDGVAIGSVTAANLESVLGAAASHALRFSRGGVEQAADVSLTPANVVLTPTEHRVLNIGGQSVGYLLFNDHVLTAEPALISAFTAFQTAGVNDLVLDLRYNGGGYLYIASQVAYMIAGAPPPNTVFERTLFNSKRASENSNTPFIDEACLPDPTTFVCDPNAPALPTLNLPRVYVLTSASTCSASEAIVNGLRGIDVEVRLIGGTTCGKPYGFFGQDNCGITYLPIEFQGVNNKGFGDYADGFIPGGSGSTADNVPGCAANDDLDHALGDPLEGQLAQALFHRGSGNTSCQPVIAIGSGREGALSAKSGARAAAAVIKPLALSSRNGRMPTR